MRVHWVGRAVYELAERFRERCLLEDGSLLSDSDAVTTLENIDALLAVIGQEDRSKGEFTEKLLRQVGGLPVKCIELTAELLAVQLLGEDDTGGERKVEHVQALLDLIPNGAAVPSDVTAALHGGGVATFAAGKTRRDVHLRFMAGLVRAIKQFDDVERRRVLEDAWAFRDIVSSCRTSLNGMQANAVLHLVFPETFSTVISGTHRTPLLRVFRDAPGQVGLPDEDRRIGGLRELFSEQLGYEIDFYDDPLVSIWNGDPDEPFEELVEWTARLYEEPDFDEVERDYKLEVAERMAAAVAALTAGGDWHESLRRALGDRNNLTSWRVNSSFLEWCATDGGAASTALRALWQADDWEESLGAFFNALPDGVAGGLGGQLSLASVLWLGVDAELTAPFRWTVYTKLHALLDRPPAAATDVDDDRPHGVRAWEQWEGTLEELRLRLLTRGVALRDMLDAQGLVYWVLQNDPPAAWDEATRTAFERFRGGELATGKQGTTNDDSPQMPPATPVLADMLYLPLTWLQETLDLLREKRQLIFYGPPGTGKTFLAQRLAEHIGAEGGSTRLVQFHPSYSYEDFFEGYRPVTDSGTLTYKLTPGPLRRLAEEARAAPDRLHLLIIDEINRGNIAKIFGELYFLLEYRAREIELQYSPDQPFSLPSNLLVIGTMNTADRSIALVDSALRRRFYFRALMPTRAPVDAVLRNWLTRHGLDPEPADLLDALNAAIADEDFAIGPSYFMGDGGEAPQLEHVWEYALMPLLDEHFFQTGRDVRAEFGLERLRSQLAASAAAADAAADIPADSAAD